MFRMLAGDVGLLPGKMSERMIKAARPKPATFAGHAATLLSAMRSGGMVGFEAVGRFDGGLFDGDDALPPTWNGLDDPIRASALDWSDIHHLILGQPVQARARSRQAQPAWRGAPPSWATGPATCSTLPKAGTRKRCAGMARFFVT